MLVKNIYWWFKWKISYDVCILLKFDEIIPKLVIKTHFYKVYILIGKQKLLKT